MKYDMAEYQSLRDGLRINRNTLDEECITQPHVFFHAAEGHTMALGRRDKAKHDLDVVVAELDKDVRDAMVSEGERVTEALVKAQVTREQDYHRAYKVYLDAGLESDKWEALKNAYRQRADMLKSLVQLYQSGYFGDVTGAAERRDARKRFNDQRSGRE